MPIRASARVVAAAAALVLTLSACGDDEPVAAPDPVLSVKIMEIGARRTEGETEYLGRLAAMQHIDMGFEVAGRIIDFRYVEGTRVKEGDVLARLDPRDFEADAKEARANLDKANNDLKRFQILYDKGVSPKTKLEEAENDASVAQAAYDKAEKAIEDAVLVAPFDGVVAKKLVEDFQNVDDKQAVLVLQDDSKLKLRVTVPESDLAGGPRSQSVEDIDRLIRSVVIVSSLPDLKIPAHLHELALTADPTTRTFDATFVFVPPADQGVLPGMTAKVIVAFDDAGGSTLVPGTAVWGDENGNSFVWVVDPDAMTVSRKQVEIGPLSGTDVSVTDGLAPGELVATSGVQKLSDGARVRRLQF